MNGEKNKLEHCIFAVIVLVIITGLFGWALLHEQISVGGSGGDPGIVYLKDDPTDYWILVSFFSFLITIGWFATVVHSYRFLRDRKRRGNIDVKYKV